jgi:C4-dicarboxylate-specific signal transduction histidine kinase
MGDYLTHMLKYTKERFAAADRNFREHHICPVCGVRFCLCTLNERRKALAQRQDETDEEWQDRLDSLEAKRLNALEF